MGLQFLIASHDVIVEDAFQHVAEEMHVALEFCGDTNSSLAALQRKRFDAVVVDCDDMYAGTSVLKSVRRNLANKSSAVLALTNGETQPADAVDLGANFVFAKPISPDRLRIELRKAGPLINLDQRNTRRYALVTPAFVSSGAVLERSATTFNISMGGVGVRLSETIQDDEVVRVQLQLPGTKFSLQARGEIAWADREGNTGISFTSISERCMAELKSWIDRAVPLPSYRM